ncbi:MULTISPECIES: hypothetical protein [unclassified Pseudoalteromonas]|uniref:hypothetical protein n=1 Tax=unclassified Pseudoalteromonas TaxID=194690 RepID=UPI00209783D3|nr:hypothetical protein [Pseudoalteromonas sp. XMcav2-N]MCO7188546.1 hypothetical protein [Pseudoalteromonas sp. XMcav2-N]
MSSANSGYQLQAAVSQNKNADIQALTSQVTQAQYTVDELSNVVSSLTEKKAYFANLLLLASNKQASALAHLNQAKTLQSDLGETSRYINLVSAQIGTDSTADSVSFKLQETSTHMSKLINKLIFSVDIIEKLEDFVNRRKAVNQIIPDELITYLSNATTESNNAIALTLTALQSCYSTITPVTEISEVSALQVQQVQGLTADVDSLSQMMLKSYQSAVKGYHNALEASDMANQQLEDAKINLSEAKASLASLQAGLDAAKAAAFAA